MSVGAHWKRQAADARHSLTTSRFLLSGRVGLGRQRRLYLRVTLPLEPPFAVDDTSQPLKVAGTFCNNMFKIVPGDFGRNCFSRTRF